jgi:hypothetical protein
MPGLNRRNLTPAGKRLKIAGKISDDGKPMEIAPSLAKVGAASELKINGRLNSLSG